MVDNVDQIIMEPLTYVIEYCSDERIITREYELV